MLNSYLELNFDLLHAATGNRYADSNDIRLVNLGAIALFSSYRLTTSRGKHLDDSSHAHNASLVHKQKTSAEASDDDSSHAHIASLEHKLKTNAKASDDLSIGFNHERIRRQGALSNNKNQTGKNHVEIMLRDIFLNALHQVEATYGLEYKLTLTRK